MSKIENEKKIQDKKGFKLNSDNLEDLEKEIESVCFTKTFLNRLKNELIKNSTSGEKIDDNITNTILDLDNNSNESNQNLKIIYKKPNKLNDNYDNNSNNSNNSNNLKRNIKVDKNSRVQEIINEVMKFINKNINNSSKIKMEKKDNKLIIELDSNENNVESIFNYNINSVIILTTLSIIFILFLVLMYRNY